MKKGVAFGDSVLRGVVVDRERSDKGSLRYTFLEDNFTSQCGKRLGVEVQNFGKFGSTILKGKEILERHLPVIGQSDFTILEYGGNDSDFDWNEIADMPDITHKPRTELMQFSLTYKSIIDEVRRVGSNPVMLSLTPLDQERYFHHFTRNMDKEQVSNIKQWLGGSLDPISSWHEMYNLQVFKLAIAMDVPVIDITSAFLSRKDYREYMCEDGIHPNERGHRLIADEICDHFNKNLLNKRRRFSFSL